MLKQSLIKNKKNEEPETELTEYNKRTEQSYIEKGLPVPQRLDWEVKNFLAQYDPARGPIEKKVTKIVRVKEVDLLSPKKERKEFMYWYENWDAKDWTGSDLPSVGDHVEGFYMEQTTAPIQEKNRVVGHKRTGEKKVFYIPFSKEKMDEVIASSIGTDKDTIIYLLKTPQFRDDRFNYEQFANNSFEELIKIAMTPGGPSMAAYAPVTQTTKA